MSETNENVILSIHYGSQGGESDRSIESNRHGKNVRFSKMGFTVSFVQCIMRERYFEFCGGIDEYFNNELQPCEKWCNS